MSKIHAFYTEEVRLGKKGQITIPKKIRDEDELEEDDTFVLTHLPSGEIMLKRADMKTADDDLFEFLSTAPSIHWRSAWEEVREERRREHR